MNDFNERYIINNNKTMHSGNYSLLFSKKISINFTKNLFIYFILVPGQIENDISMFTININKI